MKPGDKFYLIENLDIYAVIIDEKIMNNIPHYNLIIYRGQSESKTCCCFRIVYSLVFILKSITKAGSVIELNPYLKISVSKSILVVV